MQNQILPEREIAFIGLSVGHRLLGLGIDHRRIDRADLAAVQEEDPHVAVAALGAQGLAGERQLAPDQAGEEIKVQRLERESDPSNNQKRGSEPAVFIDEDPRSLDLLQIN